MTMPPLPSKSQSISPWQFKPWWCQPWSISLTGISLISGSWWLLHRWWITLLISIPVVIWMGFFLVIWPQLIRQSGILEKLQENPIQEIER